MDSLPKRFDLTGRGVGVTGGAGHLGRRMALELAGAGAVVVVCGRNLSPMEEVANEARSKRLPGVLLAEPADITQPLDVIRVLERIEAEAGSVYGWVNNAYSGPSGGLLDATLDTLNETVNNGLSNVIHITSQVAKRMIPQGRGSIVNICSMYGVVSPQPQLYTKHSQWHNPPAYGAAKAGLIQFSRYAACHLGKYDIRVNAISPGPFPGGAPAKDESFLAQLSSRVPLGRTGTPEELSSAVLFLISDAASFITGHNLIVDGGWTAW